MDKPNSKGARRLNRSQHGIATNQTSEDAHQFPHWRDREASCEHCFGARFLALHAAPGMPTQFGRAVAGIGITAGSSTGVSNWPLVWIENVLAGHPLGPLRAQEPHSDRSQLWILPQRLRRSGGST